MPGKILYITANKSDYLQDWIYSALAEKLGKNQVVDWPLNWRYHLPYKTYPKNGGYIAGDFSKRLRSNIKKPDLLILASSSPLCFEAYLKIAHKIPLSCPIIFIDGGDRPEIGGDLLRANRKDLLDKANKIRPFDLVFKREYLVNKDYAKNVFPFPFCINSNQIPKDLPSEKKYQVSFWAVESDPIRSKALSILENHYDCKNNGTTRNQVFKKYKRKGDFYLKELKRSKVVFNFRGGGWDTARYWEVPAVKTFMITQKPGIVIPNDFEDGKHCVYVKEDLSNMLELCDYYLKNEQEREQIAQQSYQHLMNHHTHYKRSEYLLDKISNELDIHFV